MVIFQRNSLALLTLNRRIAQYLLRRYTVGPLWALFKQSDSHSDQDFWIIPFPKFPFWKWNDPEICGVQENYWMKWKPTFFVYVT